MPDLRLEPLATAHVGDVLTPATDPAIVRCTRVPEPMRVAARASYRYEGTLRSLHLKHDLRDDTEIWSRLPADPVMT